MAINKIGKLSDVKKVVFTKTQKSKGGGGSGPDQPIPDDVEKVNVGKADETEEEQEQEEQKGEGEKGKGEKEKGEKGEKGEKEKGEGESEEEAGDEDGEGEGEGEGEEGEDGQGKSKGKGKGKPGEGEGEEEGEDGDGDGEAADVSDKDIDKIKKQAEELRERIKAYDPYHQECGSVDKRSEKQNKEGVDKDTFNEQEKFNRERIQAIIDEAIASGKDHPLRSGGSGRGEGRGSSAAPKGELITIPMRRPEFLRKMKQFAESEYEKQYYKKGTDWLYTQAYGDIVFKDRPKVSLPRKSVYILVDVSGSMFGDFDGSGKSLLEHLIGYLPTIAEDFVGEVWWMSSGILIWETGPDKGKEARTPLSFFKGKKGVELTKFYQQVLDAEGAGHGTVFNVEFQAIQDIREEEGHNAPIIALTDGYIDYSAIEYAWPLGSNNRIKGKLPPNTYMMTDPSGIRHLKEYYNEEDAKTGFFSVSKNIQYYDVTEEGKYKALGGGRRK